MIIFPTDIVYDPERIPDVVGLITDFLETKAGIAILACTIRNEATTEVLKKTLGIFNNLILILLFKGKIISRKMYLEFLLDSQNLLSRTCGRWEDGEIIEIKLPS